MVTAAPRAVVLLGAALALTAGGAQAGQLVHHTFHSPALAREWRIVVYEPDAHGTAPARLPALYLLHGYGGNENDWVNAGDVVRTADSLIATRAIPPFLIVMPDGGNSWWIDGPEPIETAFVEDLIPHVEAAWHVRPDREGRLIAGLSMGGYGALRLALRHPEVFGAAALFSPAIYEPVPPATSGARQAGVFGGQAFDEAAWTSHNWPALWEAYLAKRVPVPMYVVAGDDDPFHLEREAMKLYARLRESGLPAELRIVNGGHDWSLWSRGLAQAWPWVFEAAKTAPGPPER